MNKKQEIIQIMLATPAKGFVAKRFFHVTAPERHAENIAARMRDDEKFYGFILLPNSKKQTTEALICTDSRLMLWSNELADDEEIPLSEIGSTTLVSGWFSSTLQLFKQGSPPTLLRTFKCETEIMRAFQQVLESAIAHQQQALNSQH